MIIVDTAMKKRLAEGKPLRVAMVGAGYMGRGIALEIVTAMPAIRLVCIANRDVGRAEAAYRTPVSRTCVPWPRSPSSSERCATACTP